MQRVMQHGDHLNAAAAAPNFFYLDKSLTLIQLLLNSIYSHDSRLSMIITKCVTYRKVLTRQRLISHFIQQSAFRFQHQSDVSPPFFISDRSNCAFYFRN